MILHPDKRIQRAPGYILGNGFFARSSGAGAAAGSIPTDVAGLLAWWDARTNSVANMTESGGAISQLNDKSGNGNHWVQGTAAKQPTYTAGVFGSRGVARFDGTSDTMSGTWAGLLNDGQGYTIIAQYAQRGALANWPTLLCLKTNSGRWYAQGSVHATYKNILLGGTDGTWRGHVCDWGQVVDTLYFFVTQYAGSNPTGASYNCVVDDVSQTTTSPGGQGSTAGPNNDLGALDGTSDFMQFDFMQMAIYDSKLSAATLTALYTGMSA